MTTLQKSRQILKIALPSGMSSFLDILNISLALFFIAKFSTAHIVAYGAGTNFAVLFYGIFAVFSTGTNALIARLFGQNDPHLTQALGSILCALALCALPLLLLAQASSEPFLLWLGLKDQSFELASLYLEILVFELPFLLFKSTLSSTFSAISKATIPFYIKCFCTLLHIGLNYALLFGLGPIPALGLQGAALSSLICSVLEVLLLLLSLLHLFGLPSSLSFVYVRHAITLGFPTGVERILTLFSLTLTTRFLLSYGDEVLAGYQIGGRIEAFAFMPGFGFMIASMSLMGQNAHRPAVAKSYIKLCLAISSLFMGSLGFLMCFLGSELSELFTSNPSVILYSWQYLIAVGLSQIPLIFIFVLDGAFKGAGKGKVSLYINALSIWSLRIFPMYLCYRFGWSQTYLFAIICLETFIRALIFWLIFYKVKWQICP